MTPRLYKAAEVCETTGLQPYVLRSWEKEFSGIGVQKSQDSPRLYRESDIEQVRRIKQLVFGEGLTLAGARRRLDEESPRGADAGTSDADAVLAMLGEDARSRIDLVRNGLRSILDVLSKSAGASGIPALPRDGSSSGSRAGLSTSGSTRRGGSAGLAKARGATAGGTSKSGKRAVTAKRGTAVRKGRSDKRKRAGA